MRLSVKVLLAVILALTMVVGCELAHGQTATVTSHNTISIPYDGNAVPVHLNWGAIPPITGWTLIDYCVASSDTPGHEHDPVHKGCGTHVIGTTFDMFPAVGPRFYVVWAELKSTDGTKIALSTDSNEASCDLEVKSQTATAITLWCKDQVIGPPVIAPATNVTATAE